MLTSMPSGLKSQPNPTAAYRGGEKPGMVWLSAVTAVSESARPSSAREIRQTGLNILDVVSCPSNWLEVR